MIPAVTVCPMESRHLSEVAEIEALCFAEPWSANALRLLTGESGFGVVALNEEARILGYGGMLIAPDEGQITNIAVHPDHRRLGVGHAILSALEQEALDRGLEQLSLEVRVSNLAAISLYERHGFEAAGRRRGFYRHPTEDGLVMLLHLSESN
ncbi:MAG: ribosomal-protein-alanine N-acetyltransferase [Ruminococcaceae bacterium]|nr:ribosomal-protein-alanine N-acetyltransferase [Oscillospiraceae bacterium]